jgi:hypothetical protein
VTGSQPLFCAGQFGLRWKLRQAAWLAMAAFVCAGLATPQRSLAQDMPKMVIDDDVQAFDIAPDNSIVYAVTHIKGVKRLVIERDDLFVASGPGKIRKLLEANTFMPMPPPEGFRVDSLAWSPDGQKIAVDMTLQLPPPGWDAKNQKKKGDLGDDNNDDNAPPLAGVGGGRVLVLLDGDGHEIKVANSKTRFIEGAMDGTWLADGKSVVYLTGGPPYSIQRVTPADGKTTELFAGHTFQTVIWDAKHNLAYAISDTLSLTGKLSIVELDLLQERIRVVADIQTYQGGLSLSASGKKIGYFEDGDNIDVIDTHNRNDVVRVRAGFGRFGWSRDEKKVLLKRGPDDRSNILLWVGLYDGSFSSILHDLQFRNFEIAPDGESIAVTIPGKRVLKVYALQ